MKKIFGVSNKKEYFCSNKSHHASQRCVPRWDFAFYKGYMDYDKQPINVDEQVALLQNRGLMIGDVATAKLQLRNISYFRIAPTQKPIKLYHQLCTLLYMEQTITPCMDLKSSLLRLFADYPNIDLHAMGFPQGWENEPLWR